MVRKLPALATLVASLAVPATVQSVDSSLQQQQEMIWTYDIFDVLNLMKLRNGRPLYFAG